MGEYDEILGTLLIGVIFNTYLYGIVCCQYAAYHSNVFKDPLRIKLSVLVLFVLDTFQSFLMLHLCWMYLVDGYGRPLILSDMPWPCAFIPIGTTVTASLTHLFLGTRIFNMLKNRAIFGFVLFMTLAESVTGFAFGVRVWTLKQGGDFNNLKPYIIPWLSIQSALDIFVSSFISVFLHCHRTGYARTDGVINRLIRGCIQTGVFSMMLAICGLVAFVVRPQSIFYALFMIPIGRTYTTTLMDTLNVRIELKERLTDCIDPSVGSEAIAWSRNNNLEASNGAATRPPDVSNTHRLNDVLSDPLPYPIFSKRDSLFDDTTPLTPPTRRRATGDFSSLAPAVSYANFPKALPEDSLHTTGSRLTH